MDPPAERTSDNVVQKMTEPITRDRVVDAVRQLPEDATLEEGMERLYFLAKVERGVREADEGKTISRSWASAMLYRVLNLIPVLLGLVFVSACGEAADSLTGVDHAYWAIDVVHILTEDGRRVGELVADSVLVTERGEHWIAWNARVWFEPDSVELSSDSMTLDWRAHEMRFHGEVGFGPGDLGVKAVDVVVSDWDTHGR